MKRKNLLIGALGSMALVSTASPSEKKTDQNRFPNIIYILADDMGYGDVSCLNKDSKLQTVNLDRMAEGGMIFTDAHTSSSVCTPTRYGILTGRYNWRTSLKKSVLGGYSKSLIKNEELTVPELLKKAGYNTGFIGKWHLGWDWATYSDSVNNNWDAVMKVDFSKPVKNGPKEHGFDYSFGFCGSLDMPPYVYVENGMPTMVPTKETQSVDDKGFWRKGPTGDDFNHATVLQDLTDRAQKYISEKARQKNPFFLYFPLPAPHTPILPSTEFIGKSNTNFYGDFVLQVDDVVGQIMAALEKEGIDNNTLIIFTSDNGCSPRANFEELLSAGHNPNYIFRGTKADIYEGGHHVPFIVSCPQKIKGGSVSNEVICTTDLMATCADITGIQLGDSEGVDSYSLWPVLKGENVKNLREATVHHSIDGRFAIRHGKWKLAVCPGSGGWSAPRTAEELKGLPAFQLYDLQSDPGEKTNLVDQYPDVVLQLKNLLKKYILDGRSTPGTKQQNDEMGNWPQISWVYQN